MKKKEKPILWIAGKVKGRIPALILLTVQMQNKRIF